MQTSVHRQTAGRHISPTNVSSSHFARADRIGCRVALLRRSKSPLINLSSSYFSYIVPGRILDRTDDRGRLVSSDEMVYTAANLCQVGVVFVFTLGLSNAHLLSLNPGLRLHLMVTLQQKFFELDQGMQNCYDSWLGNRGGTRSRSIQYSLVGIFGEGS
jgi:hypothetical protein